MAADNLTGVKLPQDQDSAPIQVMRPEDSTTAVIAATGSSSRVTLPTDAKIIEIATSDSVHWNFTTVSGSATTSNKLLPQGAVLVYRVPSGATHIAAITASGVASATVTITRLY